MDEDVAVLFNDEGISLEKSYINTEKSLVYMEQKVAQAVFKLSFNQVSCPHYKSNSKSMAYADNQ